jgi:hypothetical protein
MTATFSSKPPSSTGRLTTSEPEIQHFPGTPQDLAQRRRRAAALANAPSNSPIIRFPDFDKLERRIMGIT